MSPEHKEQALMLGLGIIFGLGIASLCGWGHHGAAADALACNPKEDRAICALKIERNNALDELAGMQGQVWRLEDASRNLEEYWRQWVEGDNKIACYWQHYHLGRHANCEY